MDQMRRLRLTAMIDPVEHPELYGALAPLKGHARSRRARGLMYAGFLAMRGQAASSTARFAPAHAAIQPRLFDPIFFAFQRGVALFRRAIQRRSSLRGRRRDE